MVFIQYTNGKFCSEQGGNQPSCPRLICFFPAGLIQTFPVAWTKHRQRPNGKDQVTMVPGKGDFFGGVDYLLMYCHLDGKKSRYRNENIRDLPQLVL